MYYTTTNRKITMTDGYADQIVILNDRETFTGRDGCCIATVIFDGFDADRDQPQQEFDKLCEKYDNDPNYWIDDESMIVAKIEKEL